MFRDGGEIGKVLYVIKGKDGGEKGNVLYPVKCRDGGEIDNVLYPVKYRDGGEHWFARLTCYRKIACQPRVRTPSESSLLY